MKVYKYRSLTNFEFVADILCEQRFYASSFFDLNDPMEGLFEYEAGTKQEYIDAIVWGKKKLRVCSFSRNWENLLLWAHYADGFKGVCIELDLKKPRNNAFKIARVTYEPGRLLFSNDAGQQVDKMPSKILSRKNVAWEYEKEVRTLSQHKYIRDGITIKSVLLGLRTPHVLKQAIVRMTPPCVRVYETKIGRSNKVQKVQEFAEADPVARGH